MRRPGELPFERVDDVDVWRLAVTHRRGIGVTVMLLEYGAFVALATYVLLRRSVRRRFDIVHLHNPPDFLILSALPAKLMGSRVIFDVHDLAPDMFSMRFGGRWFAACGEYVLRRIEKSAIRFADLVVTVHEPYRDELVARGATRARTAVVMNSLDEVLLPTGLKTGSDAFRIVYHGTVTPHYGVTTVVEALARIVNAVPNARLEVYGEGDAVSMVEARAEELGVSDRVLLTKEYLPQRDVLARVAGASVGVVPNLPIPLNRFALSTKLFEYAALGIPAVVSDLPTLRAYFTEREVKFFEAGDAESLSRALLELASSREARCKYAERARTRCAEYSWERSAQSYVDWLERLAPSGALGE